LTLAVSANTDIGHNQFALAQSNLQSSRWPEVLIGKGDSKNFRIFWLKIFEEGSDFTRAFLDWWCHP